MAKRPPKKGQVREKQINTLLIDGNALFKVGYHGAIREVNWKGEKIGGIYQFLTVLRKLMLEDLYHKVYVFWDGKLSGKLRYDIYPDYKKSRGKCYKTGIRTTEEDKDFRSQQNAVKGLLQELSIRQFEDVQVEGDDLVAYYCINKKPYEKITICTNDRDICQMLSDDVRIYLCDFRKKVFVTPENYHEHFSHHHSNVKVIKVVGGDVSDDIKGVKGVKEPTLIKHFPALAERPVQLSEIIKWAKEIQAERKENKQKPLKAIQNIIERRTDGIQGDRLFEINELIVDLKTPLVTESSVKSMEHVMRGVIDTDTRNIKTVIKFIKDKGITRLIGTNNVEEYLLPFKKLIDREKKYYNKHK